MLRARDNLYFTKVVGMQIKATYTPRVSEPILRKPLANTLTNGVKQDRTSRNTRTDPDRNDKSTYTAF